MKFMKSALNGTIPLSLTLNIVFSVPPGKIAITPGKTLVVVFFIVCMNHEYDAFDELY